MVGSPPRRGRRHRRPRRARGERRRGVGIATPDAQRLGEGAGIREALGGVAAKGRASGSPRALGGNGWPMAVGVGASSVSRLSATAAAESPSNGRRLVSISNRTMASA